MSYNHVRSSDIKYPTGCKEINEELSTDDLIRRLKDIAMAFQQMSQEEDNKNFIPLAIYLSNDYFLDHQSRDVRLLVACSIADVFRVFAPNAPYESQEHIKRIFKFFIQQLKGLQDPKDATFKRYFYLLENLAWVKSFNICIELEDSQSIFCELFSLLFRIVNENHSDKVKNFMLDMLTPLISEADTVSTTLLKIILIQIIDPKKTSNKSAYWLASQVLQKTNKVVEPYLQTYFTKAISRGISENGDASDNEELPTEKVVIEPHKKFKKGKEPVDVNVTQICELIYELYRICPNIVQGILPHIEFKLKSNEERERSEYTKLLARLFSDDSSDLAKAYPDIWKSFLGRFRDISWQVRQRCVQYSMHFLCKHPGLRLDVTEQLRQRQHDTDENVRYEVVMAIISAGRKGIENINEDLLGFVRERTLDTKFKIRREALLGMAQLYKLYNYFLNSQADPSEATSDEAQASLRMLSWIKNKCLFNYYQVHLEDKLLVERILHTCLVPFSLPLKQRMRVLYMFYCSIEPHAARAFNELLKQQQGVRKQMKDVMELICRTDKTEERELMLKSKIAIVAKNLTEPVKAEEYIQKLCANLETNMTAKQHMDLIVTSASFLQMTPEGKYIVPATSSVVETSVREILKSLGFPVQTNSFYMIIKQLMERIAPIMVDHEGLLMLFNYVSDSLIGDGELDSQMGLRNSARRGLTLILNLSGVFPALFYGREIFNAYLLPFLWQSGDNHQIAEIVLQILTNIGSTAFSDADSQENTTIPWWTENEDFVTRLVDKFIMKASSTKQAKNAILCLNAVILDENEKTKVFAKIIDDIKEAGLSLESTPGFRFHLVALGMIGINGGYHFFPKMLRSIVQKFIVQGLLLKDIRTEFEIETLQNSEIEKDSSDINVVLECLSEEVKTKVEGIKLLVRWIFGLKLNSIMVQQQQQDNGIVQTHNSVYQKSASNAFQLLKTIIQNNGDLNGQGKGGTILELAYLRLTAAMAMLKIASNDPLSAISDSGEHIFQRFSSTLDIMSAQQWHCLGTVMIDNQEFVREKFLTKLNKGLVSLNLGLEFLAYFALGGMPETAPSVNTKIKNYLNMNYIKRRDIVKARGTPNLKSVVPECVMPFVIHLLAYMPFFNQYDDIRQLQIVQECLWFIMEPLVLKNELFSFSFFKKTFENIKMCVDRITVSQVKNAPNDEALVQSARAANCRIYAACDLALGLVMSKTQNFLLKEFPVQPSLPGKYFLPSNDNDNFSKIYLPAEMQFAPPKRCNLETEILGRNASPKPKGPRMSRMLKASNQTTSSEQVDEVLIDETNGHHDSNDATGQALVLPTTRSRKQQISTELGEEKPSTSTAGGVKVEESGSVEAGDADEESAKKATRTRPARKTAGKRTRTDSDEEEGDNGDEDFIQEEVEDEENFEEPKRKSSRVAARTSNRRRK